jgi:formylglycine-generating enzyme required for sulfatase activity
MQSCARSTILFLLFLVCAACHAAAIKTVPIGNPGNRPDSRFSPVLEPGGYGSVPYHFRIGKTEITNSQYVEFLNAVAATDTYELFALDSMSWSHGGIYRLVEDGGTWSYHIRLPHSNYSYENKPVVFIDWYDALRFANWLHNGKCGPGTTEYGAYTLLGGTPIPSNHETITRNPGARWFIPNVNEWYKAGFYDAAADEYYDFATGTSATPNNKMPDFDNGNSANFFAQSYMTLDDDFPLADVESYQKSASPYGTLQQNGNAWEWTENYFGQRRTINGGGYQNSAAVLRHGGGGVTDAFIYNGSTGFRVAYIPEPTLVGLFVGLAFPGVSVRRRRRKRRRWLLENRRHMVENR